jgi:hypothetical protein
MIRMTEIDRNLNSKNLAKALDLFTNGLKKDHLDCKEFLAQRMWQIDGSSTCIIFKNDVPFVMSKEDFRESILVKFDKSIALWHQKRIDMVELVCKTTQDTIKGNEINLFGGFMNDKKPYDKYKSDIKKKVNVMLDFMKEAMCSKDQLQFDYLDKWLANMVRGNKIDSVLYLRGPEGLGKSTMSNFIRDWVIGNQSVTKGIGSHLLTDNNSMLRGKLLVIFEELPVFSDQQWQGIIM